MNVNVDPVKSPASAPVATVVLLSVVARTLPDIDASDCVNVQVILPGPVESDASPENVPLSVTTVGVGDGVGVEVGPVGLALLEPPPLHAPIVKATATTTLIDTLLIMMTWPSMRYSP